MWAGGFRRPAIQQPQRPAPEPDYAKHRSAVLVGKVAIAARHDIGKRFVAACDPFFRPERDEVDANATQHLACGPAPLVGGLDTEETIALPREIFGGGRHEFEGTVARQAVGARHKYVMANTAACMGAREFRIFSKGRRQCRTVLPFHESEDRMQV